MLIRIPAKGARILKTSKGIRKSPPRDAREWRIPDDRAKRGEITTFSRASASRMREKCLKLPKISGIWGVTLTIKRDAWDKNPETIRKFWMCFLNSLKYLHSRGGISWNVSFLWRIELQKNGTPHWHCIVSADSQDDIIAFRDCYHRQLENTFGYVALPNIAVNIRELNSVDGAYSYISSHSTKHKQSQLGWKGRQWGQSFITKEGKEAYNKAVKDLEDNASNIASLDDVPDGTSEVAFSQLCNISDKQYHAFNRALRKLIYSKMRTFTSYDDEKKSWVWTKLNKRKTFKDWKKSKKVSPSCKRLESKRYFDGYGYTVCYGYKENIEVFAKRQAVQAIHFIKPSTARKLIQVAL